MQLTEISQTDIAFKPVPVSGISYHDMVNWHVPIGTTVTDYDYYLDFPPSNPDSVSISHSTPSEAKGIFLAKTHKGAFQVNRYNSVKRICFVSYDLQDVVFRTEDTVTVRKCILIDWAYAPELFRIGLNNHQIIEEFHMDAEDMTSCEVHNITLVGSELTSILFKTCLFTHSRVKRCNFNFCTFFSANLNHTIFENCSFHRCTFRFSNLTNVEFKNCSFESTSILDSNLSDVKSFDGSHFSDTLYSISRSGPLTALMKRFKEINQSPTLYRKAFYVQ